MRFATSLLFAACMAAGAADFTYTSKTEITGGSMKSMMGMAARFSKESMTNTTTVHRIQNDKMATQTGRSGSIVDLGAETMTSIDYDKKEYSTITFAEMNEAMKKMAAKMDPNAARQQQQGEVKWNIAVENTGQTKAFQGVQAKQQIIRVTMEATDQKSGNKGGMDTIIDSWMGRVPGSEVMKEFGKRAASKMAFNTGMGAAAMGMLGGMNMQGLTEASKKLSELDGLPLYQVTRLGAAGAQSAGDAGQAPPPQAQQQQPQSGGGLGGAMGRFGGLGRLGRKKEEPQAQQQPQAGQQQAGGGAGSLLETTTEIISWSSAPISAADMSVPAGFKQVEHPMKRQLK